LFRLFFGGFFPPTGKLFLLFPPPHPPPHFGHVCSSSTRNTHPHWFFGVVPPLQGVIELLLGLRAQFSPLATVPPGCPYFIFSFCFDCFNSVSDGKVFSNMVILSKICGFAQRGSAGCFPSPPGTYFSIIEPENDFLVGLAIRFCFSPGTISLILLFPAFSPFPPLF